MAEGLETTRESLSDMVQDVGATIQDSLVLANITNKDDSDKKYADSLTSVSGEQEIRMNNQVCLH